MANQRNQMNEKIQKAKDAMKNFKHIIPIMSGKGGVGKSSVAVNLAISLALEGKKVGLMDVDMHGPDVVRMLGSSEKKPYGDGDLVFPPEIYGIKVVSISQFLKETNNPVIWRGPLKTGTILQFFTDIQWGELDYLLIDNPPGTGDEPLTLFQNFNEQLDGTIIVTTPSIVSQDDVEKAINFVKTMKGKVIGLIENMAYFKCPSCGEKHYIFGEGGGKKLSEKYDLEVLQEIPLNEEARKNMDNGQPPAYFGSTETVTPYKKLAINLINKAEEEK